MALTTGLVQWMSAPAGSTAVCVYIGPTPFNVEVLAVNRQPSDPPHVAAFKVSMLDALAQALVSRHEVTVEHQADKYVYEVFSYEIYSVQLR